MKTTQLATFRTKNVYGNTLTYPENEAAKMLTRLTKKSTVDNNDLDLIRSLGYTIYIDSFPVVCSIETISEN